MKYQENIKKLRLEKGFTQEKIANILNKKQESYSAWERGKFQPDIQDLIKLADIYDCTVDYLIGREGEDGTIYIMGNELSKDEEHLIDKLRQLEPVKKEIAYRYIEFLFEEQKNK